MSNFESHPLHPGNGVPLFIAAGVLKEPAQLEQFMRIEDPLVVPLLTLGGYTLPEWAGNAKAGEQDFVYYPDRQMAGNSRGLPNLGERGIRSLKNSIHTLGNMGIKTIIQVTNLPHEAPLDVIPSLVEIAAEVNPTAVEVNLSCPNGKKADGSFHAPLCYNADASGEVMQESRRKVGDEITLGAKDSAHTAALDTEIDSQEISRLAASIKEYIDFITGINTIPNQAFPEITCANGRGGMSGPVIKEIAKQHLSLWRQYAPDVPYLSCGGVDTANAASEIAERLSLGALRVGGAQEFYRTGQLAILSARWAQEYAAGTYAQ